MVDKAYLPDIAIFLNPTENLVGIRECTLRNIPTVGIIDSDTDPRIVTYPIPANMEVSFRTVVTKLDELMCDAEHSDSRADTWHIEHSRPRRAEIAIERRRKAQDSG